MKSNPKESSKGTLGVFPLTKESFPTIPIPTNKKKRESAEEFRSSINRARTTACSPRVLSVPCHPTILVWNKTHPMSDVSYNSPTKRKWWGLLGRMIVMKRLQVTFKQAEQTIQKKTTNVEEKSTSPNIEKKINSFSKKVIFGWILVFNSRRVVVKMLVSYASRKGRNDPVEAYTFRGHTRCWSVKVPLVKLVKMKFPTVNQGFVQGFPNLSLSNCLIVLFSPQNSLRSNCWKDISRSAHLLQPQPFEMWGLDMSSKWWQILVW